MSKTHFTLSFINHSQRYNFGLGCALFLMLLDLLNWPKFSLILLKYRKKVVLDGEKLGKVTDLVQIWLPLAHGIVVVRVVVLVIVLFAADAVFRRRTAAVQGRHDDLGDDAELGEPLLHGVGR